MECGEESKKTMVLLLMLAFNQICGTLNIRASQLRHNDVRLALFF